MIVLYTDFGLAGPYVGEMKAVLARAAPGVRVIDLMHDAPAHDPRPAAYLLAALADPVRFPDGTVFVGVVDPGVGTDRPAVALEADGRWFVGPHNGLFELIARRAGTCRWHAIAWRPETLSASFHGRDLFAPVAARLAGADRTGLADTLGADVDRPGAAWPDDLAEVIYVDAFGNAMTGLRVSRLPENASLSAGGAKLRRYRTFGDAPAGEPFWYENSLGLAEISVNRGSAARILTLGPGTPVSVDP
ncbi:MAG: SAM-dependent chlorinase/fluorinase [Bauldia litoralis]